MNLDDHVLSRQRSMCCMSIPCRSHTGLLLPTPIRLHISASKLCKIGRVPSQHILTYVLYILGHYR